MESKLDNLDVKGRTILTCNGEPVLIGMMMRQARSAPARRKAAFVVPTGEDTVVPLPLAVPTIPMHGRKPSGYVAEFRMEMN